MVEWIGKRGRFSPYPLKRSSVELCLKVRLFNKNKTTTAMVSVYPID